MCKVLVHADPKDDELCEASLGHSVDTLIVLLRAQGIVKGPLVDPEPHTPTRAWDTDTDLLSEAADADHWRARQDSLREHKTVQTRARAVAFYESTKPVFEQAYDVSGLPWQQAAKLDHSYFFRCATKGPGAETVESFLDTLDRTGQEKALMSLEQLLGVQDNGDEDVGEPVEGKLRTPWGEPVTAAELQSMMQAWGVSKTQVKTPPTLHRRVRVLPNRPMSWWRPPMECDTCGHRVSALAVLYNTEVCSFCYSKRVAKAREKGKNAKAWNQVEHRYY